MILRPLKADDHLQYLQLLSQLTIVGDISKQQFKDHLEKIQSQIIVCQDEDDTLIACGTILIENKFIHNCGKIGHIEDIVVKKDKRKMGLGKIMINKLVKIGEDNGCYKVILNCSDKNSGFYERCGFYKSESCFRKDI